MRRIYVYVAGAISAPNPADMLENLRKGQRLSTEVLLAGYCVFSPFIDFQYFLQLRDGEKITVEMIKEYSLMWLERCDAVLLVPGWENSSGTKAELEKAHEMQIPIFEKLETLKGVKAWRDE